MATGAPGTNGVWQYGEDDSEATFSALLNKAASTTDTQLGLDRARLTTLEARKLSGLVPVVPSSITASSGSASYNSTTGLVTFTGVTSLSLNGVFTSAYDNYRYVLELPTTSGASDLGVRFRASGTDSTANLYNQYWSMSNFASGTFQSNNGTNTSGALVNSISLTNRFVCGSGDIHSPLLARSTSIFYQGFGYNNTNSYLISSGVNLDNSSTYDGITLFMRTGGVTMTGTLKIYGYN